MKNRNFKLETEWNMIHYSEKPNGFGILIIGDERHFVDEQKSFWLQNEGKQYLMNHLKEKGYTIFYSNLYGKHWGNEKAYKMAERLYHHIMRTEILNSKIHIIAEGMGALIVLNLLKNLKGNVRSIVLLNPILSLKHQLEQEKESKFFYKKLLKEISESYEIEKEKVEEQVVLMEGTNEVPHVPIKIIHVLSNRRAYQNSEVSKRIVSNWEKQNDHIQSTFLLPEKKGQLGPIMSHFFQQFEKEL
ncbi:hydrolase [Neobacillus sp. D3-1R]|uniref:hydrolase n=1 Tax=Neobacillus sp. D3-1R TaxID=3445778 RepID=UPI003F9F5620